MVYTLLVIGVALVSISLWEMKGLRQEAAREMENIQMMKKEVYQAKSDVEKLLVELNKASDRAVSEMVSKIENIREQIPVILEAENTQIGSETQEEPSEIKGQIAMEFTVEEYEIPEKHQLVYQLANEGLSPSEIAQRIQMGKGEVSLILNLRNRSDGHVQILQ